MTFKSNEEWLDALLEGSGQVKKLAWQELRDLLFRAALIYLSQRRALLSSWSREDVRALAEDLAQEAVEDVRVNLHTFRGESKLTTWAYRFAINRAASELRKQRYRNLSLDKLHEDQATAFQSLQYEIDITSEIDPEQVVVQREYINLLRDIIENELNERQRAAVIWVLWQGRSMDEAAGALGINRNALYKLLHDARQKIKTRLQARHLTLGDILGAFQK